MDVVGFYIQAIMKLNVLFLAVALVLSGCSLSIIHPPSAAAFMEKGDGDLQANMTVSRVVRVENSDKDYMLKPYDKIKTSPLPDEDHYYKDWEWFFQESFDVQKQFGNFKIGGGLDWTTPFLQAGFISDYLGVMGWSNICLWQLEKKEHAYFQWGGGITIIEQLPLLSRRLRLGLTQHLSRNGREAYIYDGSDMFSFGGSAPVFYDEIGGGAYIAGIVGKRLGMGLEFRYGRDLTYKIVDGEKEKPVNRFTLTFNLQWW
jgi:hypothetical protein